MEADGRHSIGNQTTKRNENLMEDFTGCTEQDSGHERRRRVVDLTANPRD